MTELIEQIESAPEAYPDAPSGLSATAAALDKDALWQRIEQWVAYRWTERTVMWIVKGPGHFEPLLSPGTITKAEIWWNDAWGELTLLPSPLGGLCMDDCALYRFTATIGAAPVPAVVNEAYRRLAECWAQSSSANELPAGAHSFTDRVGDVSTSFRRDPNWQAKVLENSGAADLLRSYRRLGRC